MPKEIITKTLERRANNINWGFVVIGGKDQAITIKVGNNDDDWNEPGKYRFMGVELRGMFRLRKQIE